MWCSAKQQHAKQQHGSAEAPGGCCPCSPARRIHMPSPILGIPLQAGVVKATKEGVVLDPSAVTDRRTEAEKKVGTGGVQVVYRW